MWQEVDKTLVDELTAKVEGGDAVQSQAKTPEVKAEESKEHEVVKAAESDDVKGGLSLRHSIEIYLC